MRVALHCACNPLLQTDDWFIAQVLFGSLAAVVVVGASQRHSHGREGGFKGHKRTQDQRQQPQKKRQSIHKTVGEVVARGSVSKSHQHFWHEVPKSNRFIIGDMVRLKATSCYRRRLERRLMNKMCNYHQCLLTFPHAGESDLRRSAARMWPWTTFSTKVKSTRLLPSLQKTDRKKTHKSFIYLLYYDYSFNKDRFLLHENS